MCSRDPERVNAAIRELAGTGQRIMVFKYWNVCCDLCLSREPSAVIVSRLTYDALKQAHGRASIGSLRMMRDLLSRTDMSDDEQAFHLEPLQSVVDAAVTPSAEAIEFEPKLATVYNTLASLDNGSVLQITTSDAGSFCVSLQGFVVSAEARAASQARA